MRLDGKPAANASTVLSQYDGSTMPEALIAVNIQHAADLISQADALVIAVGAGIGVDSGLPDFRGKTGF
jgi:hypothetical protein